LVESARKRLHAHGRCVPDIGSRGADRLTERGELLRQSPGLGAAARAYLGADHRGATGKAEICFSTAQELRGEPDLEAPAGRIASKGTSEQRHLF
jgi:hypothetical protein